MSAHGAHVAQTRRLEPSSLNIHPSAPSRTEGLHLLKALPPPRTLPKELQRRPRRGKSYPTRELSRIAPFLAAKRREPLSPAAAPLVRSRVVRAGTIGPGGETGGGASPRSGDHLSVSRLHHPLNHPSASTGLGGLWRLLPHRVSLPAPSMLGQPTRDT